MSQRLTIRRSNDYQHRYLFEEILRERKEFFTKNNEILQRDVLTRYNEDS